MSVSSIEDIKNCLIKLSDANISNEERIRSFEICENFKQNIFCPDSIFSFCSPDNHINVKIYGLKCLEYTIKHKWPKMNINEKISIKTIVFQLCSSELMNNPNKQDSNACLCNLTIIIVHLIKSEWPQHWPSMIDDLTNIANSGIVQKKLILSVYLRLSQDVMVYGDVPNSRKREIATGLTLNIDLIFTFIFQTIGSHLDIHNTISDAVAKAEHLSLCKEALQTLIGYVDWIRLDLFCQPDKENTFFRMIVSLLDFFDMRLEASELILVTLMRKVKAEEKERLVKALLEDNQTFQAIYNCIRGVLSNEDDLYVFNDQKYALQHRLASIISKLGSHIFSLWETHYSSNIPANFSLYLECLVLYNQHPIRMISLELLEAIRMLFKNCEHNNLRDLMLPHLPAVFRAWSTAIKKEGFPSEHSPVGKFTKHLHDDEEYGHFIGIFRGEILKSLSYFAKAFPHQLFGFQLEWLKFTLTIPITDLDNNGICRTNSRVQIEWDALTVCSECIMSTLLKEFSSSPGITNGNSQSSVSERLVKEFPSGFETLRSLVQLQIEDPIIRLHLHSLLAVFFPFVSHDHQLVIQVLEKIVSVLLQGYSMNHLNNNNIFVRRLRVHASASLVRMAKDNAHDLMPVFDKLFELVRNTWFDSNVNLLEKCVLLETIVILSSQFKNFAHELSLLSQLFEPIVNIINSESLQNALSYAPQQFIKFIGLDIKSFEDDDPAPESMSATQNRIQITTCLMAFMNGAKRSAAPTDKEVATAGGFIDNVDGKERLRHPFGAILSPILPSLFKFIRAINSLYSPDARALCHADSGAAFSMTAIQKANLLNYFNRHVQAQDDNSHKCKNSIDHIRVILTEKYEICLNTLVFSTQILRADLYALPEISQLILTYLFHNFDNLPDEKLFSLFRIFLPAYVKSCPECYMESALVPVIEQVLIPTFQRLKARWEVLKLTNEEEYDGEITDEIIEELRVRYLTKAIMSWITHVLAFNGCTESSPIQQEEEEVPVQEDNVEMDDECAPSNTGSSSSNTKCLLGALGKLLMNGSNGMLILAGLCDALAWQDSFVCKRAVDSAILIVQYMLEHCPERISAEVSNHLLLATLKGLHINGQNEEINASFLLNLAVLVYENFGRRNSQLQDILISTTGKSNSAVQELNKKLFQNHKIPLTERAKRGLFKKVISSIIGVTLSERFKENIFIRNLPPLTKPNWKKSSGDIFEENSEFSGLTALFSQT